VGSPAQWRNGCSGSLVGIGGGATGGADATGTAAGHGPRPREHIRSQGAGALPSPREGLEEPQLEQSGGDVERDDGGRAVGLSASPQAPLATVRFRNAAIDLSTAGGPP